MSSSLFRLLYAPLYLPHAHQPRKANRILFLTAMVFTLMMWMTGNLAFAQTSDQFNETSLNTSLWLVRAPAGGTAALNNGELVITVPGGSNHEASSAGLNLVRVMQPVSNGNFDVALKIDSTLTASADQTYQGLLIGGDASDYIYYQVYSDGTNVDLECTSITAGTQDIRINTVPFSGYPVPTYLRLTRVGTTYTAYYSPDGVTWTEAGSFSDSLTTTYIGPFAGNGNTTAADAPAITASFDWFENLATSTVATPTFTPASGTSFSSTLSVSIADATSDSTIYYTTNGNTPTTSSTVYSSPFTISASTTVNAIATAGGAQSAVGTASYTFSPVTSGAPVSDQFNETSLNTSLWQVVAPAGGSATVSNGALVITVPAGSNHDAFVPALDAVQVVQPISNANFDVAVKINSTLTGSKLYYGQGLMVEGDAKDYIRFEVAAVGSVELIANTIVSGTQSTKVQISPFSAYAVPTYLRLTRVGTTYTAYYSSDGANWTEAGSFTDSLVVTGLAPYAWNYSPTPANAPALTASFDWFENLTTTSTAATPTFLPASGTTFASTLSVSIADTTPIPTIYYTTNGDAATTSSTFYSGPFTISATTTVNAIATASGFTQSADGTASYTFTGGGGTGGIVSDNFDESTLNPSLWTLENPVGDGTVTMNGSAATLNVPSGTTHDAWTGTDNAVRIMQPVGNSNFSVDARFQSAVEIGNQDEGILAEQDSSDFVRFDVYYNGTSGPQLFAAGISGSTGTVFVNTPITLGKGPLILRLARSGNVWTGSWSTDGINFTSTASFTFDLNIARVGPYAGTSASTAANSPSFTAIVDYFFATSDPITNQDGPLPYGYATVDANPPGTLVEKTLADIQGTGQLEPVAGFEEYSVDGNTSNGGIYWYSYPTSGSVQGTWVRHTIVADGNAYEDMVALDVNGDGAVDIVASYNNTGNVYQIVWFENPRGQGGDPTQPWTLHVIGPGYGENNLVLADIDGDGKMDVVTPSSVFFQNSATSWTQVQYSASFRGVALLDIGSGHGAINLAGTGPSPSYNAVWYENPRETGGNARTGTWIMHYIGATPYPCGANNCSDGGDIAALNAVDVNGDGMMDVVSGQSEGPLGIAPPPGGMLWWQAPADRRNGTWIKHTIDASMIDVHKVAIGDMNLDGHLDIIVAEQDQAPLRRVAVYYDDGKGNLTFQVVSNAEGHNLCVGDVTHSGTLDILNSGHGYYLNAHPLQIFLNPY